MRIDLSDNRNNIMACEAKLLAAFRDNDLSVLDRLIHKDSLWVLPNGSTVTKTIILQNYRLGNTVMQSLIPSDQILNFIDDTAIVSFTLAVKGKYFDQSLNSRFRYIRVWKLFNNDWLVIANSGLQVDN